MSEIDIFVIPPQQYPRTVVRDISSTVTLHEIVIDPPDPSEFSPIIYGPIWVSFMADVDWYPIFRNDEDTYPPDIPDPDPTARGDNVHQCFRVPANFELQRKIDKRSNHFKVVSTTAGVLRWHIASYDNSRTT